VLAIAGGVIWGGYLLLVYGLSQLAGQNYSIGDLAIPGKFTVGTPAPDVKGYQGAPELGTPPGSKSPNTPAGSQAAICLRNSDGKNMGKPTGTVGNYKCPKGSTLSSLQA